MKVFFEMLSFWSYEKPSSKNVSSCTFYLVIAPIYFFEQLFKQKIRA